MVGLFCFSVFCFFAVSNLLQAEELSVVPQQVLDWQKAAQNSIAQDDTTGAIGYYQKIIQLDSNKSCSVDAQANIVGLYVRTSQPEKAAVALKVLKKEYSSCPEYFQAIETIGSQYQNVGKPAEALALYQQILQQFPNRAEGVRIQSSKIQVCLDMGKEADAESGVDVLFSRYQSCPDFVPLVHRLGWRFSDLQKYAKAVDIYDRLLAADPSHPEAAWIQVSKIHLYLLLGRDADAEVENLFKKYGTYPDFATRGCDLGWRFVESQQYAKAITIYDRLLAAYPDHAEGARIQSSKIQVCLDMGKAADAESGVDVLFSKYQKCPDFVSLVHRLGWRFSDLQKYAKAVDIYDRLLAADPSHSEAAWIQVSKIHLYLLLGRDTDAEVETLFKKYGTCPDFVTHACDLGWRFAESRQYAKAITIYDRLLAAYPNHVRTVWILEGRACSEIGMKRTDLADATVEVMRRTCATCPDYADALSWTAYEYWKAGFYPRATELYNDILSLKPGQEIQMRCMAGMARMYARLGDDVKVQEKVKDLLSNFKDNPVSLGEYLFNIGEEYYYMAEDAAKTGDPNSINPAYQKALSVWQQFEQAMPNHNSPQSVYFSGIVCQRLGEFEQAVVYYQRVITKWPDYEQTWHARYMTAECAKLLVKAGKMDMAQANTIKRMLYQEILQKNPECPVADFVRQNLNSQAQ
jgi:tetratricopeptide (TPR) repeat protein